MALQFHKQNLLLLNIFVSCSNTLFIMSIPKLKNFEELSTLENIDTIENWSRYVKSLNWSNPALIKSSNDNDDEDYKSQFTCYVCNNNFMKHTDKFGNKAPISVTYRYKPHKSNWRDEDTCVACFHVLKNPKFSFEEQSSWGYEGILKRHKGCTNSWFVKDLREDFCSTSPEYENPNEEIL